MDTKALGQKQSGCKVMVIEDSVDLSALLRRLFKMEGYEVDCATNGAEALQRLLLTSTLPDLILLDLMMPVMDGFEFRKQQVLDSRLAGIPVVVMTAHGDSKTSKESLGVQDFIRKPTDLEDLLAIVRKYCC